MVDILRFKASKRPNVSFIVPAYNAEATVEESLISILANMQKGDELIVVDDCSTDSTVKVLDKFQADNKSSDVKIIKHKYNKSDGAARNTGIEASQNELIFTLDSDNTLTKDSVTPLVKLLLSKKADFAAFEEQRFFQESPDTIDIVWKYPPKSKYDLTYHLSHLRVPSASGNYLFTKSAWLRLGRQPEFASGLNNWGFGLAQAAGGAKTVILPKAFYYHRHGHESLWMRDEHSGKVAALALQLIVPYLSLINDEDVDYILSKQGRKNWFYDLDKRPIKLKVNR